MSPKWSAKRFNLLYLINMEYIKYTLTMPNVGSWNGKWSGEGREYNVVRRYGAKDERVSKILEKGSYYYDFGDGWGANISVERIANGREAKKEKKKSMGFCGYEWMIDSIEKNLKILI
jgi:hypothetical protein